MSEKNSHLLPLQEKWICLSRCFIKGLFIYYGFLFVISMCISGFRLSHFTNQIVDSIPISQIIIQSFTCGVLGTSLYYYRKLYKSCIQNLVDPESEAGEMATLGVKAYFIGRPIIGAVIAVISVLIIHGGLFLLVDKPMIIQDRFYIFISIFSFLFGFSNGKLIVKLDKSRERIADSVDFSKGGN